MIGCRCVLHAAGKVIQWLPQLLHRGLEDPQPDTQVLESRRPVDKLCPLP